MKNPRNVRSDLIKPNLTELKGFGILRETHANSRKRGRPALVYYLNEEQALLLCMFSHTEKAQAVRAEVVISADRRRPRPEPRCSSRRRCREEVCLPRGLEQVR